MLLLEYSSTYLRGACSGVHVTAADAATFRLYAAFCATRPLLKAAADMVARYTQVRIFSAACACRAVTPSALCCSLRWADAWTLAGIHAGIFAGASAWMR